MSHPYHHALSSVRKYGGKVLDYLRIHQFFDGSKEHFADFRHRALRHHSEGIFLAERMFGTTITNSDGRVIPVRFIGEQHVIEDCGFIPTLADWLKCIQAEPWMKRVGVKLGQEQPEPKPDNATSAPKPADEDPESALVAEVFSESARRKQIVRTYPERACVTELGLSTRAENVLLKHNVRTVAQLMNHTRADLRQYRGLGFDSLANIINTLAEFGHMLAE